MAAREKGLGAFLEPVCNRHAAQMLSFLRQTSLVHSVNPLFFHRSLQPADSLMVFECLTRAYIVSIGLFLSTNETEERVLSPAWATAIGAEHTVEPSEHTRE